MDISLINWMATGTAALSSFAVGALWYSPALFGKAWMKVNGFTEEQTKNFPRGKIFGFSFLFSVIMSVNLAMFLASPETDAAWGAIAGFLAGFGWVAMALAVTALFENRSWKYICINAGYHVVALVIMGLILGAWR